MYYFHNENQRGLGCKFYFNEKSYDCVYMPYCSTNKKIKKVALHDLLHVPSV